MGKYRWIYIASVAAALAGYIATDKKQLLLLLLFLIAVFYASLLCWLLTQGRVKYDFEIEDVSIRGREISLKIVLKCPEVIPQGPMQMDVEYDNFIFEEKRQQRIILKPGEKKRLEFLLPYVPENSGKTCVRIKKAKIYDLLGIMCCTAGGEKEQEIIIYPDVKSLEVKKSNLSSPKNQGEAYDESKKGQDVSEVFDMREYQLGDSVKSIHWKLSGKLDKLIVREFGNPTNYQTALYYDMEASQSLSKADRQNLQNGILQMTASLSKSLIQNGFFHHMIAIEDMKSTEALVQDNGSYLQVLAEMMCRKIPATEEEYFAHMQILSQEKRFTNLIFVCGLLNMQIVEQLSRTSNLTVVYVNTNEEDSIENGENYTIISVPVGKIDNRLQMIEF